ncbi:MAG: hypothetical protein SGJ00_03085 [bacterium]|nr:hypothetical protein [bacterium]
MIKKIYLLFAMFIMVTSASYAQDDLFLRGKQESIKVKVIEIGTSEVKYKLWPVEESMPILVERKDRIKKIILQNGLVMNFSESEFVDPKNYVNQKKRAIKLDFISLLNNTTSIAYEQSMEPGRSWEVGIGLLGIGISPYPTDIQSGAFFRAGFKFFNQPDFNLKGMRYTHILMGGYIRPELVAHFYKARGENVDYAAPVYNPATQLYTQTITNTNVANHNSGFGLLLNFGKQWVFSDLFVVDFFVGGGIGYGQSRNENDNSSTITNTTSYYPSYNSSVNSSVGAAGMLISHNNRISYCGQAGLKLGILLGQSIEKKQ